MNRFLKTQILRPSTGQLAAGSAALSLGWWFCEYIRPDIGPAMLLGLGFLGIFNFVWLRCIGQ